MIDAAAQVGVDIPHYCYHPGLSAPAQCRMCLVEVERRAQAACRPASRTVAEGNVIHTAEREGAEGARGRCSSSTSSTTRSTARSATSPASASCRTTWPRKGAAMGRLDEPKRDHRARRLRRRRALRRRPLHHVHALRALHARGRAGRAAQRRAARPPQRDRHLLRRGARGATSGRTTSIDICPVGALRLQGLPAQGTRLGPGPHARRSARTARRGATSPCRCATTR